MSFNKGNNHKLDDEKYFSIHQLNTSKDKNYYLMRKPGLDGRIIIEYIISGSGYLEIKGKTYFLKKGNCVIFTDDYPSISYADTFNPYTRSFMIVSGILANELVRFFFSNINPIICEVDISKEFNLLSKYFEISKDKDVSYLSDFSFTAKDDSRNLWQNISINDWHQEYWNKILKKSKHSHYGGFALENHNSSWQNLYIELKDVTPFTEYNISFSLMTNELFSLETLAIDKDAKIEFNSNTMIFNRAIAKKHTFFSLPPTNNDDWTDISLNFSTEETEGLKYYLNIHFGAPPLSVKDQSLIFHQILAKVSKEMNKSIPATHKISLAEQIRLYIKDNAINNLTLNGLAMHFNISASHIDRIFKKVFNVSPYQYYLHCKVDMAKEKLKNNMSIELVSEKLGFSNRSHFERTFLKITGQTPAAYRKEKNAYGKQTTDI